MTSWPPKKNIGFSLETIIRDNTGSIVTTGTLTSTLIQDGTATAGPTPVFVSGGGGVISVTLTSGENNFDRMALIVASDAAEAKDSYRDWFNVINQLDDIHIAVWNRVINKANHNVPQSAGKTLRQSGDLTQISGVVEGTPTPTVFATDLTQIDDFWEDAVLVFVNGASNAGRGITVKGYLNLNGQFTFDVVDAWAVTPVVGDDFVIFANHVHPVSQIASEVWDELLIGATHNITNSAGKRLRQLIDAGNYEQGLVWLDTIKGISGDTIHDNGTQVAPTDLVTSVNTLLAALPLHGCHVALGSTVDFVASQISQEWTGEGWTLTLGNQNINNSTITGADITGISTGIPRELERCRLGNCTFAGGEFTSCDLDGTVVLSGGGIYDFVNCHQEAVTPIIDFGALNGATIVHLQNYSGAVTIKNMGQVAGADVLTFSSSGGTIILDATCVGGTVNLCGIFELIDNSSGMTLVREGDGVARTNLVKLETDKIALVDTGVGVAGSLVDILENSGIVVTTNNDKTGYSIIAGGIAVGSFAAGAITSAATSADYETDLRNAIWNKVVESEGAFTAQQVMSIALALLAGRTNNSGGNFNTPNNVAQRATFSYDVNNNRLTVSLSPSS